MNIAAYMAALDIDDLDHMAKMAVLGVAARANRHDGVAWVSTGRIADDLAVHYDTARLALDRAVHAGYLGVEKPVGRRPKWQLTSRAFREVTSRDEGVSNREVLAESPRGPRGIPATKDVRRTSEGKKRARTLASRRVRASGKDETRDLTPSSGPPPLHLAGSGLIADWTAERHARDKGHTDG